MLECIAMPDISHTQHDNQGLTLHSIFLSFHADSKPLKVTSSNVVGIIIESGKPNVCFDQVCI